MNIENLSKDDRRIYEELSEESKRRFLQARELGYQQMIQGAVMQVMTRNLSHNLGSHIKEKR